MFIDHEPPNSPELSIVIPFFNEGANVAKLLEELRLVLNPLGRPYEVICVNDGSTDQTGAELERIANVWSPCRVIEFRRNQGQATALIIGMRSARGMIVVTLDGDGQNDPADIPALLRALENGADMAVGIRTRRHDPVLRLMMSRAANNIRSRVLGDGVSDSGCALKAFRREVVATFLPIRTLYSFMPAFAVAAGFRVTQHQVIHRPRIAGDSKYGLRVMLFRPALDMLGVWWFTRRRLREPVSAPAKTNAFQESLPHPVLYGPYCRINMQSGTLNAPQALRICPRARKPGNIVCLTRSWGWLIVVVAALFLFLGTRGLNEPDEGRYAEIGREMAVSGEWLIPHLNGFEHFQKPPLLYWFTAASIRIFGVNEWAARLPSALAALGITALIFVVGKRLFGRNRGIAAALIGISSAEFFLLARTLTPDMLLTWWITASIAAFLFRQRWLFFICIGLGFLTKGPMAFVVPISAALGWQLTASEDERLRLPWIPGILLALAIGISWFVVLSLRNHQLFNYFWRYELLQRFASSAHGRSKPIWFFLPVLVAGFLPWTFFLLPAARDAWRSWREERLTPLHGLLLGWTLPPLFILSLSGSKLPTYILPLFPALALTVAARLRARLVLQIALPTLVCGLALAAIAPLTNGLLRQQASVRSLAAALCAQPGYTDARIFACEVRAHGWEFYLGRCVAATRADSDIVLPLCPDQQTRVFNSVNECERAFAAGPLAYGIVRAARRAKTFSAEKWTTLAEAGDFVLIVNRPKLTVELQPRTTALLAPLQ